MGAQYFDESTGEVLKEPDFVKVYIRDLCNVKGLSSTQYKIFNFMLENMNVDNVVAFGPRTKAKEAFLTKHSLKPQTFNNNVGRLIDASLIKRIGRSEFLVNKQYAVRVDWSSVQKIVWESTYSKDGVTMRITAE